MRTILNIILFTVPLVSILCATIYLYNSTEFIELLLSQPIKQENLVESVSRTFVSNGFSFFYLQFPDVCKESIFFDSNILIFLSMFKKARILNSGFWFIISFEVLAFVWILLASKTINDFWIEGYSLRIFKNLSFDNCITVQS